jgi:hypothetical protein
LFQIEFRDETVKDADENVSALTLFQLQKEGVIDGTFLQGFLPKKNKEDMDLDPISVLQAVYAAYRQANPKDVMSYNDFLANYDLDIEVGMPIYYSVISKKAKKKFQQNFMQKAAGGKGKN